MNAFDVTLDLSKQAGATQWVRVGQGDKSGTTIVATVYDHGTAFAMTGMTARFCMRTPGNGYVEDTHVDVSGSTLTYVVDEEHCASAAGVTSDCYFQILQGDTVIASTSRFSMQVLRAATQGADPAQSYSDDIVAATRDARDAADAAEAAMERIGTAVEDAAAAAESAAQAVDDAQTAIADADTAKREAISAANSANAAANNANSKASAANTAANAASTAAQTATSTAARAEAAISAMGDISEQAVPLMSADTRGGSKLSPKGGLELRDEKLGIGSLVQSGTQVTGPIAGVTAKGWAEQFTTTGKNLYPTREEATLYGNVFTPRQDGSVRVTGTHISSTYNSDYAIENLSLSHGTYTLSGCPSGGSVSGYALMARVSDGTNRDYYRDLGNGVTFTVPEGSVINRLYITVDKSFTTDINLTFYPQLELGSTVTSYEPYSGGLPSPRPDWEQPIEVARGRNLLDESAVTDGKYLASGGTETTDAAYSISDYIPVKAGSTYVTSGMGAVGSAYYAWYTLAKEYISATKQTADGFTLTAPANAAYVRVSLLNASLGTSQLELGSTPTPYVPYGHVGLEVQGKNLLDESLFAVGSLSSSGAEFSSSIRVRSWYVPVKPNTTYMLSVKNALLMELHEYTNDKTFVKYTGLYGTLSDDHLARVTTGATTKYVRVLYRLVGNATITLASVQEPMLNEGSTATSYEPYFHTTTPIPLPSKGYAASLPDGTKDVLTIDGAGKWEWECPCAEVVLDGNGSVSFGVDGNYASTGGGYWKFDIQGRATDNDDARIITNRLTVASLGNSTDLHGTFGYKLVGTTTVRIRPLDTNENMTEAILNAWLSTHPVTVLYPLATPTTESGYIDLPSICGDAVVTCPELDELGVEYWVEQSVFEAVKDWYERARSEYADRLTALEQTVAELATT